MDNSTRPLLPGVMGIPAIRTMMSCEVTELRMLGLWPRPIKSTDGMEKSTIHISAVMASIDGS